MRKTIPFLALCAVLSIRMPALKVLADDTNENKPNYSIYIEDIENLSDEMVDKISNYCATTTMYSKSSGVNIRKEPNTESDVLDQMYLNTSVEVIAECDGWSCISTCNGIAFIASEYLSDHEVAGYTEEDLTVLAHLLAGECQSYPDQEQLYVGSVVLNRVNSKKYPDTIKKVVFQRGQYSCTRDGNYYRTPTERNWSNARWLLENGSVLPANVVFQSGGLIGKLYMKTRYHYYGIL